MRVVAPIAVLLGHIFACKGIARSGLADAGRTELVVDVAAMQVTRSSTKMQQLARRTLLGLDTNGDGAVNQQELSAALAHEDLQVAGLFDVVDSNHDGSVTLEELKTLFEKSVLAHRAANPEADPEKRKAQEEEEAREIAEFTAAMAKKFREGNQAAAIRMLVKGC